MNAFFFLPALLFFCAFLPLQAQNNFLPGLQPSTTTQDEGGATVTAETSAIAPGESFRVAFTITPPAGWHAYYQNPGYLGEGPSVTWQLPAGFSAGELQWPVPHISKITLGDEKFQTYGYEKPASFIVEITPPESLPAEITLSGKLSWQVCNDSNCLPQNQDFTLTLPSGEARPDPAAELLFARANQALPSPLPADWSLTVSEKDDRLVLDFNTAGRPVESAYFYDDQAQIDSQSPQPFSQTDSGFRLELKRNTSDNPLIRKPTGDPQQVKGILELSGPELPAGLLIDQPLTPESSGESVVTPEKTTTSPAETEEEEESPKNITALPDAETLAAGARLYDDSPAEFVTLDGKEESELTILSALPLAFLGGFLLNLMPCVFPVLSLKVLGFVQQAGEEKHKVKFHGLVFTGGLVLSMWILSGLIIILGTGWGGQLTDPVFLAGIIILLFVLGLNMAGVFEIGTSLTSAGGNLQSQKGYSGSFFSGVLTTLIATPCSGPFLGSLLGFALALPPFSALIVFTVFALGIAFPYLFLSFFPALISKLPRPGAWMESFKVIMSFGIFATAAFFMISFISLTGSSGSGRLLFALVIIALAAWAYGRWFRPGVSDYKKIIWGLSFPVILTLSGLALAKSGSDFKAPRQPSVTKDGKVLWQAWFPGKIELERPKGRIIWHDYGADWCLTCQLNEQTIFTNEDVIAKLEEYQVILVKSDWTDGDPAIDKDLARFKRKTVPTNIVYPADGGKPIMMPEFISVSEALEALEKAK
ncbi:MAG: protein-disulfide reductase DsbD family protein [Verrucomicrobiales bacterium]